MKRIALPTADLTVDEVMRQWPATIRVFLDFSMHCVGCPIATFHTVDDACSEHGMDRGNFLKRLREIASGSDVAGGGAGLRLSFGEPEQGVRVAQHDPLAAPLDQSALLPCAEDAADGM
jgi:hybrid cluster-associated redox disulfide protein